MSLQNKFMKRLFRKVDGVVIDATTGKVGVRGDDGIFTIDFPKDKKGEFDVSVNLFDQFSFNVPGFASQVAFENVKAGDLVLNDKGVGGWVVGKTEKALKLADHTGSVKTYQPPKVNILGSAGPNGVLVVQTLFSLTGSAEGAAGLGQQLLPLMLLGGDNDGSIDKLLPLLLMQGALGGDAKGGFNPLMLLALKDGGLGGDDKLLKLMALGGLGGGQAGAMNPIMLLALAGDGDIFGSNTGRGTVAPALKRTGAPALQPRW